MNLIAKCNCCVCESVCKYKPMYQARVETILNTIIDNKNGGFFKLKDCPHIEVSIKCPHMVTATAQRKRSDNNAE